VSGETLFAQVCVASLENASKPLVDVAIYILPPLYPQTGFSGPFLLVAAVLFSVNRRSALFIVTA